MIFSKTMVSTDNNLSLMEGKKITKASFL